MKIKSDGVTFRTSYLTYDDPKYISKYDKKDTIVIDGKECKVSLEA